LVLVLIVGPGFIGGDSKPDTAPILTIIPDNPISSGATVLGQGNPNGGKSTPPPPVQVKQETKTPIATPTKSDPPKAERPTPKDSKPDRASKREDPLAEPKKHTPNVNLTQVTRDPAKKTTKQTSTNDSAADDNKNREKQLAAALSNIKQHTGHGTEFGDVGLPTGSGISVGAFGDILKSVYFKYWQEPTDATMEDAVVKVTVTVARDGSVLSARITRSSGDPAVDRSVDRVLRDVTTIAPFPPDWKESQRQFQLSFSLKAKRSIG
jgi:TonB family protein